MKTAVKVRTVKKKWFLHRDTTWSLEVVGQSGRILGLCNLYRKRDHIGSYYESDRYSMVFVRLADWRQWIEKHLMDYAREFVQAERCEICTQDCFDTDGNPRPCPDREERIRIRLKGE